MLRAFIALELPIEIQQRLAQVTNQLKQELAGIPIRWVPENNIHLTLMFLGDVSDSNLQMVKDNLVSEVVNHLPFEISVGGLGVFPSLQRPRVIWVGVEAPGELMAVQSGIEHRMIRLGYAGEGRPFSPHLTVGRVSRNANATEMRIISQVIQPAQVGFLGVVRVDQIHLFRSDLNSGGAVYTRILSAEMEKKPST